MTTWKEILSDSQEITTSDLMLKLFAVGLLAGVIGLMIGHAGVDYTYFVIESNDEVIL